MSQFPNLVTGTYTGTGAAISISLGFIPDWVEVINYTDGDILWKWSSAMTNGHAIQVDTAVSKITSNGVSTYSGSTTVGPGFTIGSSLSESGKVFAYVAMRKG